MKTKIAFVLTLTVVAIAANSAAAAPRRWSNAPSNTMPRASYSTGYRSAAEVYPKYYGGCHSRALDPVGIPNGDIGLRGNGFTASPW